MYNDDEPEMPRVKKVTIEFENGTTEEWNAQTFKVFTMTLVNLGIEKTATGLTEIFCGELQRYAEGIKEIVAEFVREKLSPGR